MGIEVKGTSPIILPKKKPENGPPDIYKDVKKRFNNDDKISYQEADQVIKLIFQLLDENKDNLITKDEIIDLKNIIEIFSWAFGEKLLGELRVLH